MVLPPYVYKGDWRETRAHFDAVIGATPLPCMLYNNPIAYGTDVLPEQMVDLAVAPPEPRRGEGVERGRAARDRAPRAPRRPARDPRRRRRPRSWRASRRVRWAGSPGSPTRCRPSRSASSTSPRPAGSRRRGRSTTGSCRSCGSTPCPKFVQLIKLVQQETGLGSETVRPPRLPLASPEREAVLELVRYALARRPGAGLSCAKIARHDRDEARRARLRGRPPRPRGVGGRAAPGRPRASPAS